MQDIYASMSDFGRILGALFYYPPSETQNLPLLEFFQTEDWQTDVDFLPSDTLAQIQQCFDKTADLERLNEQYQTLFIGPNALPAPPWGSVYLDKEAVIFGSSLLELREFMQQNQIGLALSSNEPEDHFGLMLMLLAYLAENQPHLLQEYLTQHLLPWSPRFLTLLAEQPESDFYAGLGLLSGALLNHWQQRMSLSVKEMPLYR